MQLAKRKRSRLLEAIFAPLFVVQALAQGFGDDAQVRLSLAGGKSGYRAQSQQSGDQSDIPAEEYAIYDAVIGKMFAGGKLSFDPRRRVKMLVIKDRTVSSPLGARAGNEGEIVKRRFSSISQETIDDYAAKNAKSHQLTKSFNVKLPYTLITREQIEQMFKRRPGGWDEFYKQFPDSGGYIALSRAGLNSTGNRALVYIGHGCETLCGSGHYLLLVKKDKKWIVQKRFMALIS